MKNIVDLVKEEAKQHFQFSDGISPQGTLLLVLKIKGIITEQELYELLSFRGL